MSADYSQSQFNYGIAFLMRLDRLEQNAQVAAMNENFDLWYNIVQAMYRDLHRVMKPEERVIVSKLMEKARVSISKKRIISKIIIVDELTKAEVYLKEIVQLRGMAVKFESDPKRALLG